MPTVLRVEPGQEPRGQSGNLFAALPHGVRRRLTERLLRPGGSPWVRTLVEGKVRISTGLTVRGLTRGDGGIRVALDDGSTREADAVILATGYRFSLDRLQFLAPELRAEVELEGAFPKLDRSFRSTAPGVLFVGYPAEGRFGPVSRFVLGTGFTSPRVRRVLA